MYQMPLFLSIVLTFAIMACATSAPMATMDSQITQQQRLAATYPPAPAVAHDAVSSEETSLFLLALQKISNHDESDLDNAQSSLEFLIKNYPGSKWYDGAQGTLSLLHERKNLYRRLADEKARVGKLEYENNCTIREKDKIHEELRGLNEKYQAELFALQQENEQLKKDLQLLKDLELQLNKRGKQLNVRTILP